VALACMKLEENAAKKWHLVVPWTNIHPPSPNRTSLSIHFRVVELGRWSGPF
jgi:hypothetical protein